MNYKKPLLYFVVLSTLFSLVPVVPFNYSSAATCDPAALRPVSYGQRGAAVRNAQACLMEAGHDIPAGATGYYGSQTRNAVREFYKDWYGAWSGDRLGPQGVEQLRSLLARGSEQSPEPDNEQPTPEQPQQTQQNNQFMQLLPIIIALSGFNLDATTTNQLMQALSSGNFTELATLIANLRQQQQQRQEQQQEQQQQQTTEEGFLTVEQDPSVVAVTLREGETGKAFGLRMRADNGDVNVQSIFLRWTTGSGTAAPYRTISKIEVVDDQRNVLFARNVDNTTFYQDSSLNYYLPVTGLNFRVPKNTYKSLFVQVTVAGTLPSGVNTAGFYVNANDVRGVDGAGVQRFAPAGTISQNFTIQPAIAGQADWVVARNVNTPKEGYLFGSIVDGKLYNQKVLSLDVTAKYDSLRMTQVSGSVSGNATVTAVYLRHGSQTLASSPVSSGNFTFNVTPANFTVGKDQTVTLDIYADFANGSQTETTSSVTVTGVSGQNSLGDSKSKTVSVASDVMHYLTVGPQFVFKKPTTQYTPPSQTASSSYTVAFEFDVTPVNGNITMGTTTSNLDTYIDVDLQYSTGTLFNTPTSIILNVYQGSTDVTNSLPVDATSTLFVLSQGQTYTFKVTAAQNGVPSGGTAGLYRWIVDMIRWRLPGSTNNYDATWTESELVTGYTNVQ